MQISPIPNLITQFIQQNHVLSIACFVQNKIWSASCFYAFDENHQRLIILTKSTTQHGSMMLENPHISGTIAGQPDQLTEIEGIQFQGAAKRLSHDEFAEQIYYERHPIAKLMPSEIWEIRLDYIKHTANKVAFAQKTEWQRKK